MKTASIKELKTALSEMDNNRMTELFVKLIKYKKENKEMLTYLIFDADDEQNFITQVKTQIDLEFKNINKNQLFLAKKTIRKVLRTCNKFIKYSGNKQTEIEILIHFCKELKLKKLPFETNKTLENIFSRQIIKINKAIVFLHEDLQFDYNNELMELNLI